MNKKARRQFVDELDEELNRYLDWLPEASILLGREAGNAYACGAYLATIMAVTAAIESLLRSRFEDNGRENLAELVRRSPLDQALQTSICELREFRNAWVHVPDPHSHDDELFLVDTVREDHSARAYRALETMRSVFRAVEQ